MSDAISVPALREVLRRAVLTLASVPDSDLRFRFGHKSSWPEFVRHARDAYGAAPPKVRIFHPTRNDLTIYLDALGWLSWYGRQHRSEATVRLFIAWSFGAAMWQLQERVARNSRRLMVSPSTVHNRMNGMVLRIGERFCHEIVKYDLDELRELAQKGVANRYGAEECTDARSLPKSPKNWADPRPFPLTNVEKVKAHARLEKTLQRNRSRASRREERRAKA